jgi:hypothetical protein
MKYYKRVDKDGNTTTVEAYSHDKPVKDAVEITEQEFNSFISSLPAPEPVPVKPSIDDELQGLKDRVTALEQRTAKLENVK